MFGSNVIPAIFAIGLVAHCQSPIQRDSPFQVRYAANLIAGESYINIINTGSNGAPLNGPGFSVGTGNICVNIYAVDPTENLISCCSCLVTPNQTVNLGVNRDMLIKTLTPVTPPSATILLIGSNPNATNCTNTAALVGTPNNSVTGGFVAFGTTLHATKPGVYASAEAPFAPAQLSSDQLSSLTGRCAFIIGNGSGYGTCLSCELGALTALKQ